MLNDPRFWAGFAVGALAYSFWTWRREARGMIAAGAVPKPIRRNGRLNLRGTEFMVR